MAKRMLLAILVGTVFAFAWGAFAWTAGIYDFAFKPLPGGEVIASKIEAAVNSDGAFIYPAPPVTTGMSEQQAKIANDAFLAEHRKGPLMMTLIRREGVDPMSPTVLGRGFIIEFFTTALLASIIAIACRLGAGARERVALAVAVPAFAMLASHGVMWNFFHLPDGYSMAVFFDGLVAWWLAGISCAVIIRPEKA